MDKNQTVGEKKSIIHKNQGMNRSDFYLHQIPVFLKFKLYVRVNFE